MGKFLLVLLGMLFLSSCYADSYRYSSSSWSNRNFIYYEEIRANPTGNVYDLVVKLRANWLFSRNMSAVVFIDNMRYGTINVLRDLPTSAIVELEFLKYREAFFRFGYRIKGRNNIIIVTIGAN